MRYRQLGATGVEVSEIGFGTWGIGRGVWVGAEDSESLRALRLAVEMGINFFDSALVYGDGLSESLVGQVARESRDSVHVATKIPPLNSTWPARSGTPVEEVFPREHIERCTKESLVSLGLDRIDLQQLHVWHDEWLGQGDWLEAIDELKGAGLIRFFGVSVNDHQPDTATELVRSGLVDVVQVIYNIFDQSAEDELLDLCAAREVGVIARVPFDEGSLTGALVPSTVFDEKDFRSHYFRGDRLRSVSDRVDAIVDDLEIDRDAMPQVALRFCLSHPAVSTVIPGMRKPERVATNCAASELGPLSVEWLARLRNHRWVRDFYWT